MDRRHEGLAEKERERVGADCLTGLDPTLRAATGPSTVKWDSARSEHGVGDSSYLVGPSLFIQHEDDGLRTRLLVRPEV